MTQGPIMEWTHIKHDSGRADAGFTGRMGDCAPRAIALALRLSYVEACELVDSYITKRHRNARPKRGHAYICQGGTPQDITSLVMIDHDWEVKRLKEPVRLDALHISGEYVLGQRGHAVFSQDGVLFDTHDSTRTPRRRMYREVLRYAWKPTGEPIEYAGQVIGPEKVCSTVPVDGCGADFFEPSLTDKKHGGYRHGLSKAEQIKRGRELLVLKESVPHGGWADKLAALGYDTRRAQEWMRLAR